MRTGRPSSLRGGFEGNGRCIASLRLLERGDVPLTGRFPLDLLAPFNRVPPDRAPELMDAPECDRRRLHDALETLSRVNRWLGGTRLMGERVRDLLRGPPGPIRILDIGCGAGDIPLELRDRLERRGWRPSFVLSDVHATTLSLARERLRGRLAPSEAANFAFVRLDGAALPFGSRSFDLVLCSSTLHHLGEEAAVRLLREVDRVAARGWALTDLRRSWLGWASTRVLAATVWRRNPFPRQDGPASVRRAFTPTELRTLLRRAGPLAATVEAGPIRLAAWHRRP